MASFATPAELAAFANATLDTPRMQALLDLASGVIRQFTGQTLSQVLGDQVEFGPRSSTILQLPEVPVTAVSDISVLTVTTTAYEWGRWGLIVGDDFWTDGAVVTYDHGYAAASEELESVKAVCMASASRAFTMNERSASEALGSTLMESAGYSPEVFLTPGERDTLMNLISVVTVG